MYLHDMTANAHGHDHTREVALERAMTLSAMFAATDRFERYLERQTEDATVARNNETSIADRSYRDGQLAALAVVRAEFRRLMEGGE